MLRSIGSSGFWRTVAALACVGMLAIALLADQDLPDRRDFRPYHEAVRQSVESIPLMVGSWQGQDVPLPASAVALLRPNALRNIRYQNVDVAAPGLLPRDAFLTVVQCERSQDMFGHYPPNCYQAYGDRLMSQRARRLSVGSRVFDVTEYVFENRVHGPSFQRIVLNFMVVPERGIVRDMKSLIEAAEDYRQRYYGAAQVQVVFAPVIGGDASRVDRDDVAGLLLSAALPAIETIESGRSTQRPPADRASPADQASPADRALSGVEP
jgi:hypothetical protein